MMVKNLRRKNPLLVGDFFLCGPHGSFLLRVTLPVTNVETSQRFFGPNRRVISKRFFGEFILSTSGHKKNWIQNSKLVGKNHLIIIEKITARIC